MDLPSQATSSSLSNKRKRGRPRRDESKTLQQVNTSDTTGDENLIGQVVSGVVEGSFEAGYFLNVKVADTQKQLKGVVFLPEKVTPVTPTTDLFPQAKMYARGDFPVPSINQRSPLHGNQTDDLVSDPQTIILIADKKQSAKLPSNHSMSSSEAIGERNLPIDTQTKDVGGSSAEEKLMESQGQTLSLMPQFSSDDAPKEDLTVQRSQTGVATPETTPTTQKQPTGSGAMLSLELFQNETNRSGTEEEKSYAGAERCGLNLMVEEKPASPSGNVPEELQLELGNKKMSCSTLAVETKIDQPTSSMSGCSGTLCVGREETAKQPNTALHSGFPEAAQVDANDPLEREC